MVTVHRAQGLRFIIYGNDHVPAHVHVFAAGAEAKINLLGPDDRPQLVWAEGMSRGDIRRAMQIVDEQQAMLLVRWEEIHG